MAPATLRTRRVQWACYKQFCSNFGLDPLPCDNDQLALYATFLSMKMTATSVNNYLHAVIVLHKLSDCAPPDMNSGPVKLTTLGIRNHPCVLPSPRQPVTLNHLKKMYLCLDLSKTVHVMFWSCLLTMFRSLLRVSHVTVSPHNMLRKDVCFSNLGMLLTVHSSKTSHISEPPRVLPIASINDYTMCPVYWLKIYLASSPCDSKSALFRLGDVPLTYSWFQTALRKLLKRAGISSKITSHSFRKGGATLLSALGMPLDKIKVRGGWKSDAALRYIQDPVQVKIQREKTVSSLIDDLL